MQLQNGESEAFSTRKFEALQVEQPVELVQASHE